MNDAVQAYQLALSVRDQRRRWRGDSVEAILMAVVAAMAYTDSDGAWKLLQPAPMGDALEYETVDPRLRRERAVLAASTGRPTEALELAEALNDPYVSALVRGWQALRSSDEAVACAEWHLAFEAAPSDSEKLQVAKALAALGKSMPDLHNLAEQHPAAIKTINVIYKALSRPGDRLVILRAEAHKSVELSSLLGETLVEKGDLSGAAKVYRDAAYRWTFPIFLSMAGSLHFRSKNYAEAAKATTQALTMAGPGWSGELSTQITRFDTLVADGKLQEAIDVARRLIVLAPDDDGIRWSLVGALLQNGEVEGAWSALNYNGVSIDPRNQNEALVWINLGSPRDKSKGFLRKALEVIRDKINDPEAVGGALLHLQLGLGEPGRTLPQQDLEEFRAVSDKYVRDYPNSKTYRMISGGDDENPLAAISKVVQERSNQTKGLEGILTQAHNGALPLGFLTDIQRQPYIEGAIYRATTLVFSHNIETSIKSAQDVSESLATDVVIDGTAAVTLSLLDEGTRQDLIHQFSGIITTDHAYRDAISSEELLRRRPTLWIDWDEAENRIAKKTITDAAAERLYRQSVVALEILSNCGRQGWYELKHYADFDPETAWLSALDYAVDANHPFWCDDQCLRALAADKGVPTFGTVDLLRELDRLGRLSTAETKASEAVLIANYHVDLGFDTDVMLLAAQLDGWAPFGTAASLTRAAAWDDPRQVLAFLLRAVRENAKSSPHHVQEWVALVSSGAAKLTGDDSSQAAHNVRLIIDALVQQKWMQPDLFPFIIRGARQSLPLGQTFESELQSILSGVHGRLRERMPAAVASANLLSLVTYLDPDDQALAARIILGESL
jgi:tetratricopeptide (TPR) repeat protein